MSQEGNEPPVRLPDGTVDLAADVVPAVRAMLRRGLPEDFQSSCVRVGAFDAFGGGMKSELVGGLRIDVRAAMKLGGDELELHGWLMEQVNAVRPRTFPGVQAVVPLRDGRRLLFMEQLLGHERLLDLVYRRPTSRHDLERVVGKVFEGVRAIRRTGRLRRGALARELTASADPFSGRIRDKLDAALASDAELASALRGGGEVLGEPAPPLGELLGAADELGRASGAAPQSLCHGDLHLANVMARRRGKGFSVRFVDPNPAVGFTDPLYDGGKLLHWAEPVGWLCIPGARPRTRLDVQRGRCVLEASVEQPSRSAEARRAAFEALVRERIVRNGRAGDATRMARLHLATASAHVGMAALLLGADQRDARRFAVAHAVRALGRAVRAG